MPALLSINSMPTMIGIQIMAEVFLDEGRDATPSKRAISHPALVL